MTGVEVVRMITQYSFFIAVLLALTARMAAKASHGKGVGNELAAAIILFILAFLACLGFVASALIYFGIWLAT